jgi:hypothetical protein
MDGDLERYLLSHMVISLTLSILIPSNSTPN